MKSVRKSVRKRVRKSERKNTEISTQPGWYYIDYNDNTYRLAKTIITDNEILIPKFSNSDYRAFRISQEEYLNHEKPISIPNEYKILYRKGLFYKKTWGYSREFPIYKPCININKKYLSSNNIKATKTCKFFYEMNNEYLDENTFKKESSDNFNRKLYYMTDIYDGASI